VSDDPRAPLDPAEEHVPEDDAIIGRALRISGLVLLAIGGALALVVLALRESPPEPPPPAAPYVPPRLAERTVAVEPAPFTDVTAEAGIAFVPDNGAAGDKLLPETMGGGCAFLDLEDDGDPDLLLVGGRSWTADDASVGGASLALYENDGTGRFDDVTEAYGLDVSLYGMGAAVGDVEADGDRDLFVSAVGPNRFFRREADRFVEDTEAVGLAGDPGAWGTSAAFFDADGDADLDLYVCNYVRWSPEIDMAVDSRLTGVGRAYAEPQEFAGSHPSMYENDGAGVFTDVSEESGVRVANPATGEPIAKGLGVHPFDVDDDGDLDLFVANDTVQNFLLVNDGDGRFAEQGMLSGVAFDRNGNATGAMGIDAAHYRNDDAFGFAIGNFANEMSSLYVSQDVPGQFADEAIGEGIGAPTRRFLSFGVLFLDYDLDGRLDLLQANGHLEDEINLVQESQHYEQPAQLFWNAGDDGFVEVPHDHVGDLATPIVGRGLTAADVDGDGDLDALVTQSGRRPMLLRNDQATGHHWLAVRPRDARGHPDAIGASVELVAGGARQVRTIMPARSYLSQVEPIAHFGLGAETRVESLRVRWPDGEVQQVDVGDVDRRIVVERE